MSLDEMPLSEFIRRRRINPYVQPCENVRGYDLFCSKQQALIYLDVIKSKQNIYVPVQWIDLNHMR